MSPRVAYLIPARDKVAAIALSVTAALEQTYAPMEILISDQGSTDGTRAAIDQLVAGYTGPNTVRVLDCPDTARRGMAGLNAHLDWMMRQTDAELVLLSSADDYALPERTVRVVEAFDVSGADMVRNALLYLKPGAAEAHAQTRYARAGLVEVAACIREKVGGSSAAAWRRSFWERVAPLPPLAGEDVYLPPLACVLGGLWFIAEPLHVYVEWADARNTGLQGVIAALPEGRARHPMYENMQFQTAATYHAVLEKMQALQVGSPEQRGEVARAVWGRCVHWLQVRMQMALEGVAPAAFPI